MPTSSPLSLGLFGSVGSLKSLSYTAILAQPNPKPGRLVYDTTNQVIRFYNGSTWEALSGGSTSVQQKAANFSSLTSGTYIGEIAYVNQSEGTPWLPGTLGGTYYPAGWYLWDGSVWVSDRNSIVDQLQLNVDGLGNKANIGHTHVKADIVNFNEADYATSAQGLTADSALQPGDNISELANDAGFLTVALQAGDDVSELNNDEGFISLADLGEGGLTTFFQEFTYTTGDLTKIEYWDSAAKNAKYYTKDFTYTTGALTQIVITNEATSSTETKTFNYDGSGNLIDITQS